MRVRTSKEGGPLFPVADGRSRSSSSVQDILHRPHCLFLHIRQDVGVEIQRDGDGRVSKHLLNDLGMYALGQEEGGAGVFIAPEPEIRDEKRDKICMIKGNVWRQAFLGARPEDKRRWGHRVEPGTYGLSRMNLHVDRDPESTDDIKEIV